jgi:glycosyltransferase involved in cell wall biosynthesis
MKVVLATHFFFPTQTGGTEAYTLGLARALRARGHEPHILCAGEIEAAHGWPPRATDDVYDGIPVHRLSWDWRRTPDAFETFYDNPGTDRLVREYLAELRPDVVHVTSCYSLGGGVLRVARAAGCRTVLTLTDFWFLCVRHTLLRGDGALCAGPRSALDCQRCMAAGSGRLRQAMRVVPPNVVARGLLAAARQPAVVALAGLRGYVGDAEARLASLRQAFGCADAVIAPTAFMKQMLAENGYPAQAMRVSPYGHDLSWGPRPAPRPADGTLAVGYLGQIEPLKGVDVAIDAVRALDPGMPVRLAVYGPLDKNPAYADRLRQAASGDDRIRLAGPYGRADLADILASLDVVVVPSRWYENAPLVISEAFAAKRPAVVTDLGGMSEVVHHEVNGLLFPRGSADGLAQQLRRLATEDGLLGRLRDGIGPVRTIDQEVDEILDVYQGARAPVLV